MAPPEAATRRQLVSVVLLALGLNLLLSLALHARCVDTVSWEDGRWAQPGCYSDIVSLWHTRDLDRGFPYLESGNEYPVGTGVAMGAVAMASRSAWSFLVFNAALLSIAAMTTVACLVRLTGWRALWFALSPSLLLLAFVNWDLLAIALTTLATLAFFRGRPATSGLLLGLGAATKLYPVLVVPAFALDLARRGDRRGAVRLAGAGAAGWLAVNLPVALFRPARWAVFFRYSRERPADVDSLWYLACHLLGKAGCMPIGLLNALSLTAFLASAGLVWRLRRRRSDPFPVWTFALPLLICFLLTTKVYSPQYSLWLLPWFLLALPDLRWFAAFSVADVVVVITRFSWFGQRHGVGGLPEAAFLLAVAIRAAVLLGCLAAWVRMGHGTAERSIPGPGSAPA